MVRAMLRRCCWPPDKSNPLFGGAVSSHRARDATRQARRVPLTGAKLLADREGRVARGPYVSRIGASKPAETRASRRATMRSEVEPSSSFRQLLDGLARSISQARLAANYTDRCIAEQQEDSHHITCFVARSRAESGLQVARWRQGGGRAFDDAGGFIDCKRQAEAV
jgi:hypothetical protein